MDPGDKSQGLISSHDDDEHDPSRLRRHGDADDEEQVASPSRGGASSATAGFSLAPSSAGSSSAQSYKSEHYVDFPMSAAERAEMDEAAEAEERAAAATLKSFAQSQSAMLSDALHNPDYADGDEESGHHIVDPAHRLDGNAGGISNGAIHSGGLHHASLELEDDPDLANRYKFPVKQAVIALVLLGVGIACLILGIIHLARAQSGSFAFVLIGAILIIPGSYQTYMIYHAWRRTPGFSFSQLAAYEGR